jgi:hypothetical protein
MASLQLLLGALGGPSSTLHTVCTKPLGLSLNHLCQRMVGS